MGKKTIAEFVTDEPTQPVVERLGVDHAQGDYIGAPGALEEVGATSRAPKGRR